MASSSRRDHRGGGHPRRVAEVEERRLDRSGGIGTAAGDGDRDAANAFPKAGGLLGIGVGPEEMQGDVGLIPYYPTVVWNWRNMKQFSRSEFNDLSVVKRCGCCTRKHHADVLDCAAGCADR